MGEHVTFRAFGLSSLLAAAPLLAPGSALADVTKDQCVDANAKAQPLRRDGKLGAARVELQICTDTHCPSMVRDDCAQRLDELERAQPTIVFEAKDSAGNDVSVVRVAVDGRAVTDKLDGSALAVDPGEHAFTFEVAGEPTVTRRLVLHEGEKGRREHIVLLSARLSPTPAAATPAPSSPSTARIIASPQPPQTPVDSGSSGRKTLGLVLGGVGVAGIAVGSIFGVLTIVSSNNSKSECNSPATPTNCPHYADAVSDHSSALTDGTISTIGFIAGGGLLAGGLALWLTAPSGAEASPVPAVSVRVSPTLGAKAAGIDVTGEF
jgi:hypothetical protein